MGLNVLSSAQVDQFIECGYAVVEEAFPRKQALKAQEYLWQRLAERDGVRKDDPTTWTRPMIRINENYNDSVFQQCATERLAGAMDDLLNSGRRRTNTSGWGWWPVNFAAGADKPWDVPATGWHWDGIHFRHFVDSPEQGLLTLCIFSEVGPHGGGTVVAEGSHKLVARFLQQHPEGLELNEAIGMCASTHPWLAELTGKTQTIQNRIAYFMEQTVHDDGADLRVVDTTGAPGDVILCHPFLYHASSQNHSGVPRFMCNRTAPLKERLNLQRGDSDYSPLEISIRNAIFA
ncbi:hypothetical protein KDH_42770 [Dictyobacter sp. S3.2.2.5]|uniref:Phytanoyl-CoA dioxygenase n=1 Tax=Dictyobacter halimunensis TaxID=3026934 RepID=A0ABQ6FT44_9CHLR|nr:hypothetical protein KDH_42770 [Dictyobacter sp. S3.2.2.5]